MKVTSVYSECRGGEWRRRSENRKSKRRRNVPAQSL